MCQVHEQRYVSEGCKRIGRESPLSPRRDGVTTMQWYTCAQAATKATSVLSSFRAPFAPCCPHTCKQLSSRKTRPSNKRSSVTRTHLCTCHASHSILTPPVTHATAVPGQVARSSSAETGKGEGGVACCSRRIEARTERYGRLHSPCLRDEKGRSKPPSPSHLASPLRARSRVPCRAGLDPPRSARRTGDSRRRGVWRWRRCRCRAVPCRRWLKCRVADGDEQGAGTVGRGGQGDTLEGEQSPLNMTYARRTQERSGDCSSLPISHKCKYTKSWNQFQISNHREPKLGSGVVMRQLARAARSLQCQCQGQCRAIALVKQLVATIGQKEKGPSLVNGGLICRTRNPQGW